MRAEFAGDIRGEPVLSTHSFKIQQLVCINVGLTSTLSRKCFYKVQWWRAGRSFFSWNKCPSSRTSHSPFRLLGSNKGIHHWLVLQVHSGSKLGPWGLMESLPVSTAEDLCLGHAGHHIHCLSEAAAPGAENKASFKRKVMDGHHTLVALESLFPVTPVTSCTSVLTHVSQCSLSPRPLRLGFCHLHSK